MSDIIYNIADESLSPLPKNSSDRTFTFIFEGFDQAGAVTSNKDFFIIAKLTDKKKRKLKGKIVDNPDSVGINFNWKIERWHFDFLMEDYLEIEPVNGYIYFVRENDEEKITQENFEEKTENYQTINVNEQQIVNNAIRTLREAWEKIKNYRESTLNG